MKKKLAVRTASLLGTSQPLRDKIVNEMGEYYQDRSDIVHVLDIVTREKLREITIPNAQEYLRQSIKKFFVLLLLENSFSDIKKKIKELANINDYIFSSGKLLP